MVAKLWTTVGTTSDDYLIGGAGASVRDGSEGDDYILGDSSTPFDTGTTTNIDSPYNIDDAAYWTKDENPFFGNAGTPHTSLYVEAVAGHKHYASVTVGAGQTITIDVDFGEGPIDGTTDTYVRLLDSTKTELVYDDDASDTLGGAGTVATAHDSYISYTNSTASAQTYIIEFEEFGDDNLFEGGETFVANISVSGHATGATTVMGNDTLAGGLGDDHIAGQGGDDLLQGNAGYDSLYGGSGNDTLDGGADLDTAWYTDATDSVTIDLRIGAAQDTGGAGTDTLISIESVAGSKYGDDLTGSDDSNTIRGRGGDDLIYGLGGTDYLYGDEGDDTIHGGLGSDFLYAEPTYGIGSGNNTLLGEDGDDYINGGRGNDKLAGGDGDDSISDAAGNDVIQGGAGTDDLRYWNADTAVTVNLSTTTAQDTVGAGMDTITGIENLQGSYYNDSLTGNGGDNRIFGYYGNDIINGGAGDDLLAGQIGDDTIDGGDGTDTVTYSGASAGVTVNLGTTAAQVTGEGTDTISAVEDVVGSFYNDKLYGNDNSNTLDGGEGNDILRGNGQDDMLLGGGGKDVLVGGSGDDRLAGGDSEDTASYAGANAVTVDLAITTAQNTGGAGTDTITGVEDLTGSSNDDVLYGDANVNRLDGGDGADTLVGREGNDTYVVDNAGDNVVEAAGFGVDTVLSSITYQLESNVERLNLTGSAAVNGIGNGLDNAIRGNDDDNMVDGKLGNDTLTGAGGKDLFRFDTALGATNVDHITDFTVGSDKIQLDDDIFTGVGATGTLAAGAFYSGSAAHDASDRIIYDAATGNLYYDPDGDGAAAQILFAELDHGLSLTNSSFQIIG